jgi:hypothetical protein
MSGKKVPGRSQHVAAKLQIAFARMNGMSSEHPNTSLPEHLAWRTATFVPATAHVLFPIR